MNLYVFFTLRLRCPGSHLHTQENGKIIYFLRLRLRLHLQSKLEAIKSSRHKERENVHARATIGFDWLKKWRENFEPITDWSNARPK